MGKVPSQSSAYERLKHELTKDIIVTKKVIVYLKKQNFMLVLVMSKVCMPRSENRQSCSSIIACNHFVSNRLHCQCEKILHRVSLAIIPA